MIKSVGAATMLSLILCVGMLDAFFLKRYDDDEVRSFDAIYGGGGGGGTADRANFINERRRKRSAAVQSSQTEKNDSKKKANSDDSLAEGSEEDFFDELSRGHRRVKRAADNHIEDLINFDSEYELARGKRSVGSSNIWERNMQNTFELPNDDDEHGGTLGGSSSEEERKFVARSVRPARVARGHAGISG